MRKTLILLLMLFLLTACNPALADVGGICAEGYDNFNHGYKLTDSGVNNILAVAQLQVGLSNSTFRYHSGGWCAAFVNDCAFLAGQGAAIPYKYESTHAVGGLVNAVLNAGGYWVNAPQAGDLVIYYCSWDGYYSHVGIMENGSSSIQGNVDDQCKRLDRPSHYWHGHQNADGKWYATQACVSYSYLRPNYRPASAPVNLGESFNAKIRLGQEQKAVVSQGWGNVELDTDKYTVNQDWRFDRMGNGSYIITNLSDGRVMDLSDAKIWNGTNISLCSRWADSVRTQVYQRWYIFPNGDGYMLSAEAAPSRSLDAATGYIADGSNIQLFDTNYTNAQWLTIEPFSGSVPTGIAFSTSNMVLNTGDRKPLSIRYLPDNSISNDRRGITWKSSDETVATVDDSGLVRALSEGTCTITATSTYNTSLRASCTVTVECGIQAPKITKLDVNGLYLHLSWSESPAVDENDVRAYEVFVYPKGNIDDYVWSNWDVTGTSCDITLSQHGEYDVYVRAVNETDGTRSSFDSRSCTVLDDEWMYVSELPDNLQDVEVQYLNQYDNREQTESPGEGWTCIETKSIYVNGNIRYSEDPTPLQESDTLVYLGTFYYHYCDGNSTVEHYWTDRFQNLTRLDNNGQFDVVWQGADDADPRFTVYRLKWNSGQWAGGLATCAHGYSDAMALYYLGHRYQERTHFITYVWAKETDWSDEADPNADSVSYRIRRLSYEHQLQLPANLTRIEAEAFLNDLTIQEVIVPSGCEYIGSRAFAGCADLRRVYLPSGTIVESDAFDGCPQVQVIRIGE